MASIAILLGFAGLTLPLQSAPSQIQYGLSYYSDDLTPVVGGELGAVLGSLSGVNVNVHYRKAFYKDLFFFRSGLGADIAIPKQVRDTRSEPEVKYTVSQYRVELPILLGISSWNKFSRVYIGSGLNISYYELEVEREIAQVKPATNYTTLGFGFTQVFGIMMNLSRSNLFFMEFVLTHVPSTGRVEPENASAYDAQIDPRYFRFNFGFVQGFPFF